MSALQYKDNITVLQMGSTVPEYYSFVRQMSGSMYYVVKRNRGGGETAMLYPHNEGVTWLVGIHTMDSPELKALLVARALAE